MRAPKLIQRKNHTSCFEIDPDTDTAKRYTQPLAVSVRIVKQYLRLFQMIATTKMMLRIVPSRHSYDIPLSPFNPFAVCFLVH